MKLTGHAQQEQDPFLYLQLGELIASTGDEAFAARMLAFVDRQVAIQGLHLQQWTLPTGQPDEGRVRQLGSAGSLHDQAPGHALAQPLLQALADMEAPLLIQQRTPPGRSCSPHPGHQCSVASRSGDLRWLIGFHRLPGQKPYALTELSLLKALSDTLLPLVEQHAQLLDPLEVLPSDTVPGPAGDSLQQAFGARLAQQAVTLSAREQEVCLGLLTGVTVPALAERLHLKSSSVETYLKRATAKLGVRGRHGLTRWMVDA